MKRNILFLMAHLENNMDFLEVLIKKITLLLFVGVLIVACQPAAISEPMTVIPPTVIPSTAIPPTLTSVPTDFPTPTQTPVPTDTPVLPTATITASPKQPVNSIDEIVGVWKGRWSDINTLLYEFKADGKTELSFSAGGFLLREQMTVNDGTINYLSVEKSEAVATKCHENPKATYEIYITKRGDKPESLSFKLIGEDSCVDRQDFLDGKTLQWEGPGG